MVVLIKIGLIGAPGSGKAMLGHALWQKYLYEAGDNIHPMMAENAGNMISAHWNQAVGRFGTWREDLWAFFMTLEDELGFADEVYADASAVGISVGTILGPLAHAAAGLETCQLLKVITEDTSKEILKRQQALATLSMLFFENWDYNLVYYLPLPEWETVEATELEWAYNVRVDRTIKEILEGMGIWHRITKLTGSTVQRAEFITNEVKSHLDKVVNPDDSESSSADVHG